MKWSWGGGSLLLAVSCGGAAGAPTPTPAPPSTASVAAPTANEPPAAALSGSVEETCKVLAERNQPSKVPLPVLDDPDAKLAPLGPADFPWEKVGKCHAAQGGAWALDLKSGGRRADVSEAELVVLTVELVYIDASGGEARLELPAFNPYFAGFARGSVRIDVEGVADLTDDPHSEIALCVTATGQEYRGPGFYVPQPISACVLFGILQPDPAQAGQVIPVDTAPIADFMDADKDGRLDFLSAEPFGYPGRPGYCSLKSFACMEGLEEAAPKLLYHSIPGGFNPSDGAAYDFAQEECKVAPRKSDFDVDPKLGAGNMINIVHQVGCAVLYRLPRAQVESWLQVAANALCQDPGDCEEFQVLTAWLGFDVPIDLSKPRP